MILGVFASLAYFARALRSPHTTRSNSKYDRAGAVVDAAAGLASLPTLSQRQWNGRHGEIWTYRYLHEVPPRAGEDALLVNWCDLTITHQETDAVLLNLLAFLLHTIAQLADEVYQRLRQALGTRRAFFNATQALMRYMVFPDWSSLLSFMFVQLELEPD